MPNELDDIQEAEGQSRSVMEFGNDVFGIESREPCADLSQAQFCNAFNEVLASMLDDRSPKISIHID